MIKNTIVFLMAMAGTGKRTIAQEIIKQDNGFKFIHNHSMIDPILSLLEDCRPPLDNAYIAINQIRDVIFNAMVNLSSQDANFVISNEMLSSNPLSQEFFNAISNTASQRQARFIPIRLLCKDLEKYLGRGTAADRAAYFKARDIDALTQRFKHEHVFLSNLPTEFTLDVTSLSAKQSAQTILAHLHLK